MSKAKTVKTNKTKAVKVSRKTSKPKHTRYRLMFKYWKEGKEESPLTESTVTTDYLRTARAEFRNQLRMLVYPVEIDAASMKRIVEAGYVVASGSFFMGDADRFAMILTDTLNPVEPPAMYAFVTARPLPSRVMNGFSL